MANSFEIQGIQCQFKDPDSTKVRWAFESLKAISGFIHVKNRIGVELEEHTLFNLTRRRLKLHLKRCEDQMLALSEFLEPLGWKAVEDRAFSSYMLSHPGKSELLQNYDYIFRDWVWGEDENRKSTELISSILPGGYSPKRVLVLGSGAGRLAYDLNKLFQPDSVTLVDRNPLLMMVAKSLISGESLNLVEFPYLPSSLEGIGIDHTITGVLDNSSNFQFVLADIKDFDFAQNQYDLIVTPWLIDVLDMDFPRFSAWLSEHLESSALWINYGPLGFNSHKLKHCYSFEEARHIVQKAGFLFENESLERVEYMKSPYSLSSRVETVFTFSARKQNEVRFDFRGPEVEPSIETLGMGNFYPTLNYSFSDGHKLSAFVFEALESHRLLSEIIDEVVTKFHLSKLEAKMVVDEALQTAISEMERNPLR